MQEVPIDVTPGTSDLVLCPPPTSPRPDHHTFTLNNIDNTFLLYFAESRSRSLMVLTFFLTFTPFKDHPVPTRG